MIFFFPHLRWVLPYQYGTVKCVCVGVHSLTAIVFPLGSNSCLATMANRRMKVSFFVSLSFAHHQALSLLLAATPSLSPCSCCRSHTVTVCLSHFARLSHLLTVPVQFEISGCYWHKSIAADCISVIVSHCCTLESYIWHIAIHVEDISKNIKSKRWQTYCVCRCL